LDILVFAVARVWIVLNGSQSLSCLAEVWVLEKHVF